MAQLRAFAAGVLPDIYAFHRYTGNSRNPYLTRVWQFPRPIRSWAPGFNPRLARPPTDALRPIIPDNACLLCLTAAAGTELAEADSSGTVIVFVPEKSGLQPTGLHPTRGVAPSGLRPLRKIPHCCLP